MILLIGLTHIDPSFRYAMERNEQHISIWFWARDDPTTPDEIKEGLPFVNSLTWVSLSSSMSFHLWINI